jgi:hypothetical protein
VIQYLHFKTRQKVPQTVTTYNQRESRSNIVQDTATEIMFSSVPPGKYWYNTETRPRPQYVLIHTFVY